MEKRLLEVKDLKKYYPVTRGLLSRHAADVRAVDGVSFLLTEGETLGLVGESGCGKSTLGRTLLLLERPTTGKIIYQGADITAWDRKRLKKLRQEAQMIFQDPQSSLDPRMTVGDIIGEPLVVHNISKGKERRERVQELLRVVGLNPYFVNRYPHEFSGGQRQRIAVHIIGGRGKAIAGVFGHRSRRHPRNGRRVISIKYRNRKFRQKGRRCPIRYTDPYLRGCSHMLISRCAG